MFAVTHKRLRVLIDFFPASEAICRSSLTPAPHRTDLMNSLGGEKISGGSK